MPSKRRKETRTDMKNHFPTFFLVRLAWTTLTAPKGTHARALTRDQTKTACMAHAGPSSTRQTGKYNKTVQDEGGRRDGHYCEVYDLTFSRLRQAARLWHLRFNDQAVNGKSTYYNPFSSLAASTPAPRTDSTVAATTNTNTNDNNNNNNRQRHHNHISDHNSNNDNNDSSPGCSTRART